MFARECDIAFQKNEKILQKVEGKHHSLLFTDHNRLFVKGQNAFGQLGLGHFNSQKHFVPCFIQFNPNEQIAQIALGPHHSLLLTNQNRVLGSGFNYLDQLHFGDGTVKTRFVECPITLKENEIITKMQAGFSYSQLTTNQNRVIIFGTKPPEYTPKLFTPIQQPVQETLEWSNFMFFGF